MERAIKNNIPSNKKAPLCFNIRTAVDTNLSLSDVIHQLKEINRNNNFIN